MVIWTIPITKTSLVVSAISSYAQTWVSVSPRINYRLH
jgi:hypothetical protein